MIGLGSANRINHLFLFFTLVGFAGLVTPSGGIYGAVPAAKWFIRRRGTAMGLATLGMGVGAVVFLPVTQILIEGFGWRTAWHQLAILSVIMIIPVALIFLRRQPEDMGLRPDGDPEVEAGADSSHPVAMEEITWTVKEAFRTRTFWLLNAAWAITGFWQGGNQHRIPYWIELGFEGRIVSYAFAVDAAAAAVMILAAGILLDRFPARYVAAVSFIALIAGTSFMLFASNTYHLFSSAILTGSSVGVNLVCQTYLWASYYGRTFLGTIRGFTLPAMLFATAVGAPTVGYIYDFSGGYESAWKLLIGICSLALLCMLAAKPPSGKPSKTK
jgi:MFS family permease